ncbi:hypothetical protein HYH02_009463 [Chlamydomonas schloesseri]|uniref:Uncharacterized protein n=1 Tax=Chlamydomonas schloesseri TaxID=2026947 RepID=A0A835TDD1_9CHLO|nr:hypothetical protein HYH02_009463 [Chlamydomonas schloesseri]|eukprot:KAG2443048.1 hypothetical protein HYH02_009463 [Chlamydomonas schloesseri]
MPGDPLGYTNTRVGQLVVRGPDWAAKTDGDDDGGAGQPPVAAAAVAASSSSSSSGGGMQVVTVKWCKTGLETTAHVRGGTAGSRRFCVAVMDVVGE